MLINPQPSKLKYMFDKRRLTTEEKALKINLTPNIYGSFAEIGAGQEVAANFFKAGGSSGTIAYSHSAYDMKVSDSLYGECQRYVCEDRLMLMLDNDYKNLIDTLPEREENTRFFAFANTVEQLNYHKTNQGQGWVGIRFQLDEAKESNDIVLHVKMHDNSHKAQQEALGILGVNLIHAAYFHNDDLNYFLNALMHRLPRDRMEIDMLRVTGPDFENVDNRVIALNLVKKGLTDATMFDPDGNVLQPSAALYKKNILMMRGRFRPVTNVHLDMLENGRKQYLSEPDVDKDNMIEIFELTLKDLTADGKISDKDFVDRADLVCRLGYTVMISNYLKHYKMVDYISSFTRRHKIGVILGIYNLKTIFEEDYYNNLPGGILEAFGRGFGHNVKMYVYPALKQDSDELWTFSEFEVKEHLVGLLKFMIDNNKLEGINEFDDTNLHVLSDHVLDWIKSGDKRWEDHVPAQVQNVIKDQGLFGCKQLASVE